jgi:hypothetical protein
VSNCSLIELDDEGRPIHRFEKTAPKYRMHFHCGTDDGKGLRIMKRHDSANGIPHASAIQAESRLPLAELRKRCPLRRSRKAARFDK